MRFRACSLLVVLVAIAGCGVSNGESSRPLPPVKRAAAPLSNEAADAEARLLARLAPRLEQSSAGLTPVTRKDGGRSLRMNGTFSQAQIARRNSDGSLSTTCVDDIEAAKVALRGAAQ